MIIGITGKSGSGKTYITNKLNEENRYIVIDVDKLVYDILNLENVKNELVNRYGKDILTEGKVDTKRLGKIVFTSKETIDEYNQYIWKYIKIELEKEIKNVTKEIIIDWSLLPLSDFLDKCDVKVLVELNLEERKRRIISRDNVTEEYFDKRESYSLEYTKEDYDIIVNSNDLKAIQEIKDLVEERKKIWK